MDAQGWAPEGCELFLVVTEEVGVGNAGCQGRCFARALRTLVCYYAGANRLALALEYWRISHRRRRYPREDAIAKKTTEYQRTTYESRRFFFFDDFFSFFFDDGTGVSSGFLFPATCTNAPDAGAAPASFPSRCALASSIA